MLGENSGRTSKLKGKSENLQELFAFYFIYRTFKNKYNCNQSLGASEEDKIYDGC